VPIKRKSKRQQKHRWLLNIAGIIIALVILSLSDLGLVRYFQLRSEHKRLITRIDDLKLRRDALQFEKKRLEDDMEYIEKIAREKFRMVKPGEKVFRVRDSRTVPKSD